MCLYVCAHSHGHISWSILTKFCTDTPSPILLKNRILGHEVLKIHANINSPIAALNVRKLPKFLHLLRNRGGRTEWWRQIFDWK